MGVKEIHIHVQVHIKFSTDVDRQGDKVCNAVVRITITLTVASGGLRRAELSGLLLTPSSHSHHPTLLESAVIVSMTIGIVSVGTSITSSLEFTSSRSRRMRVHPARNQICAPQSLSLLFTMRYNTLLFFFLNTNQIDCNPIR